jgi:hypothetical protein
MELLDAGQSVIELGFVPVQKLPGQDLIVPRITVPFRDISPRLLRGEHG